ncbi:MAG: hypothetical protein K0S80_3772, partial [Neobacillus sp.]|nr:hypothetical protein [Neobacillus sp.]
MIVSKCIKFAASVIGIILVGCLPALFKGISINIPGYLSQVDIILHQLVHINEIKYPYNGSVYYLFPSIVNPYFYSMIILFGSLIFSFVIALAGLLITYYLPVTFKRIVLFIAFIGESLPDVSIIVLFQFIVIGLLQETGILVMNVVQGFTSRIYLMPILCLSVLPACFFFRMMVILSSEQEKMDYVEFAKSKGLMSGQIFFKHILRNIMPSLVSYSKSIILMLLSNLVLT